MSSYRYSLFADYFQFYLQDERVEGVLANAWGEQAVTNLLAVSPGTISVGTVRNMEVPVEVEVLDSEPVLSFDEWDQVNECDIEVKSGVIVVAGCTDISRKLRASKLSRETIEHGSAMANLIP